MGNIANYSEWLAVHDKAWEDMEDVENFNRFLGHGRITQEDYNKMCSHQEFDKMRHVATMWLFERRLHEED